MDQAGGNQVEVTVDDGSTCYSHRCGRGLRSANGAPEAFSVAETEFSPYDDRNMTGLRPLLLTDLCCDRYTFRMRRGQQPVGYAGQVNLIRVDKCGRDVRSLTDSGRAF